MFKFFSALAFLSLVTLSKCKRPQKPPAFFGRLMLFPEAAQLCENVSQPVRVTSLKFEKLGATSIVLSADGYLDRLVKHLKKSIVTIKTCADSTLSSCQHFQTWRFNEESCTIMKEKDTFWSPAFNNVQPDLHCPIQPGNYHMRNGTLDMKTLQSVPFPIEKYYWRVRIEAFDHELVFCVDTAARILRQRS